MRRALILCAVAGFLWPAAAQAQTYVVPVCNTGSAPHSMSGWAPIEGLEMGTFTTCAVGGGFGVYQPLTPDSFGYWEFEAPADVRISTLRVWRHGTVSPVHGVYQLSSRRSDSDILELETERNLPATNTLAEFKDLNTIDAAFTVFCHEYTGGCGADPTQNRVTFTRVEMVLEDRSAPRAVGALTASGTGYATQFSDAGGGVREAAILVDGAELGRTALCSQPYASAVPCPLSGRAEVPLDTRALATGTHRVQIALTDVAGNRTLTDTVSIDVNHPVEAVPVPSLRPGRVVAAKRTVRARHDRRPVVSATVLDSAGAPIAGSPVAVATRTNVRGSSYTAAAAVVTDARGRVTLRLPTGPSRVVRLTYGDSVATVSVKVRAPLRLSVSPKSTRNGRTVKLTGSVAGTKLPTRIELQAYSGGHWFPFKTVALRKGKFSGRYRFTRTFSAQRYRFRAVVHTDRNFPYEAATSKVVSVSVRP